MNLILNSDSYKYSHFAQYPPETAGDLGLYRGAARRQA
jgi:nicotinic acid phosphoribosyltransferase